MKKALKTPAKITRTYWETITREKTTRAYWETVSGEAIDNKSWQDYRESGLTDVGVFRAKMIALGLKVMAVLGLKVTKSNDDKKRTSSSRRGNKKAKAAARPALDRARRSRPFATALGPV